MPRIPVEVTDPNGATAALNAVDGHGGVGGRVDDEDTVMDGFGNRQRPGRPWPWLGWLALGGIWHPTVGHLNLGGLGLLGVVARGLGLVIPGVDPRGHPRPVVEQTPTVRWDGRFDVVL